MHRDANLFLSNSISRDSDEGVVPTKEKMLARKRRLSELLSVSKLYNIIYYQSSNASKNNRNQKFKHVRPRVDGVAPLGSIKNTEREGSPTRESVRQALQAQTAPSGQLVKTIRASLLLISTNSVLLILLLFYSKRHTYQVCSISDSQYHIC